MLHHLSAPRRARGRARPPRARAHRGPREDDQEGEAQARRQRDVPQPVPRARTSSPSSTASSKADEAARASALLRDVKKTNFPKRAKALAAEVKKAKPDLIGLQEVARYYKGPLADPAKKGAKTPVYDWLKILQKQLKARGLKYTVRLAADRDQRRDRAQGGLRPAPDARQRGPRARRQEAPREDRQGRQGLLQVQPARGRPAGPDAQAQPRLRRRVLQHAGARSSSSSTRTPRPTAPPSPRLSSPSSSRARPRRGRCR